MGPGIPILKFYIYIKMLRFCLFEDSGKLELQMAEQRKLAIFRCSIAFLFIISASIIMNSETCEPQVHSEMSSSINIQIFRSLRALDLPSSTDRHTDKSLPFINIDR